MKTINKKPDVIEKQEKIQMKESDSKPKYYSYDEAMDLAGELKTYFCFMYNL